MAALVCTKTDAEIPYMFNPAGIQLDVFERKNQPDTPLMRIHRLLSKGQLYDLDILRDAMRENLGDMTFQEAFNRTRWILNITVSSTTLYDMPRLLNYITAPDVVSPVHRHSCMRSHRYNRIAHLVCSVRRHGNIDQCLEIHINMIL